MPGYPCGCCKCPCPQCDGDTPPCCFKVVISGIVEGSCGECDCLNDTFYAPRISNCIWQLDTSVYSCDSDPLKVTVYLDGSDYKLKVELGGNVWIKDYSTTKPTCENLTDESIAYSASGSDCDASSSTCLVTAIAGDEEDVCPPPGDCEHCLCDVTPSRWNITLAGVVNAPGDPCDCSVLNGDYVVSDMFRFPVITASCRWLYTFPTHLCSVDLILFDIAEVIGGISIGIVFRLWPESFAVAFLKEYLTGDPDCRNLSNEQIPYDVDFGEECDFSSSTCHITAIP